MVAINPATGPIPKPPKRQKKAPKEMKRSALSFGGKKPREAGRRYEQRVVEKYANTGDDGLVPVKMKRQIGSGAFGKTDPSLVGDILIDIGKLRLAAEAKSWATVDGRGEKTITVPASVMYKIEKEAEQLGRDPVGIFHLKNSSDEWAFIRMDWWVTKLREYESMIRNLELQLDEALDNCA